MNTKVKMEQKSLEEDRKSTENNEIYHSRLLKASRLLKNQTFTNEQNKRIISLTPVYNRAAKDEQNMGEVFK